MGKRSAILAILIFIFGYQDVHAWFGKKAKKGTVRAVEECLKRNKSDLVSKEIIKAKCVEKNQILLPDEAEDAAIDATASFKINKKGKGTLEVTGVNSSSYIITEIGFTGKVYSADGKLHQQRVLKKNLWIEPGGRIYGGFDFPYGPFPLKGNNNWCSDVKGERLSCKAWGVKFVYGVKLNVD